MLFNPFFASQDKSNYNRNTAFKCAISTKHDCEICKVYLRKGWFLNSYERDGTHEKNTLRGGYMHMSVKDTIASVKLRSEEVKTTR